MLDIRPICEHCAKDLPNGCAEAMICSFECTFCSTCVSDVLHNVCPNCGGGFEKRPTRPTQCITPNCIEKYPVSTVKKHWPVNMEAFRPIKEHFKNIDPAKR